MKHGQPSLPPAISATKHFLSRIPGRNPVDKLHTNVGHAKSAVTNYFSGYDGSGRYSSSISEGKRKAEKLWKHTGPDMEIYELVDDGWKLLYQIRTGDEELPWKKGELAAFRGKFNTELMSERDKLNLHIAELGYGAYLQAMRTGWLANEAQYLKAYENGFRAAKAEYDKNGE